MDIKLTDIKKSLVLKLLAIAVVYTGIILFILGSINYEAINYGFQSEDYKDSRQVLSDFENTYYNVRQYYLYYQNEEYIKSGQWISEDEKIIKKNQLIDEREYSINNTKRKYEDQINSIDRNIRETEWRLNEDSYTDIYGYDLDLSIENDKAEIQRLIVEREELIKDEMQKYDLLIDNIEKEMIESKLEDYDTLEDIVNEIGKSYYYSVILKDGTIFSNTSNTSEEFYKNLPKYEKRELNTNDYQFYISDNSSYGNQMYTVFVGLSQEKYDAEYKNFNSLRDLGLKSIYLCISGIVLVLLGLIWLMMSAGPINMMDRPYLDINLVVSSVTVSFATVIFARLIEIKYYNINYELYILFIVLIVGGFGFTVMQFFTSFAKRVKSGEVIKHTFIFFILKCLFNAFKSICIFFYKIFKRLGDGIGRKFGAGWQILTIVLLFGIYFLSIFFIAYISGNSRAPEVGFIAGSILTFLVISFFIYYILNIAELADSVSKIRAGDISRSIPERGNRFLKQIAHDVNSISHGFMSAVENEVRAEKMKTQLITNVSHDLKTPLTSVINYIELLSAKNIAEEDKNKYVDVLRNKSQRLKSLVEDLFEVSKAQSGTISLNLEKLCLNDLFAQCYAEASDLFEKADLDIRLDIPAEKIMVKADGTKMWRVITNILNNISKYSMKNTRAYIEIKKESFDAVIIFKNIANYEMKFSTSEITERFRRGDESRSSEGSGLGLSIAESFMKIQKGDMGISVDGDLFKVKLVIPLAL